MSTQAMFKGTGVALITPFKNGQIDFESYEKIIEHVISGDVDFLVPLGSTGESATISLEEERRILDFVIQKNDQRKPILAGCFGGKNTAQLLDKIKGYNFDGIDGILSASPEYSKPTQEGIYQHYMTLAKASPVPIMMYNVPGRTKSNMEAETTLRLAKASNNFIGIKEASADLVQITKIIKEKPEDFIVTSGDDPTAMVSVATGTDGVISVIGNVFPKLFSEMMSAALRGDFHLAKALNDKTFALHDWLYIEGNPVGIKKAAAHLGLCDAEVRLPLTEMTDTNYQHMKIILDQIIES